jgi:GNAT superfamily N-acetyltransferase
MFFSPPNATRHAYRIGWLAVTAQAQRRGIGSLLVEHACAMVEPPATLEVVTFGEDIAPGRPARRLYERFGFHPAESVPRGPDGGSRQMFRRTFA